MSTIQENNQKYFTITYTFSDENNDVLGSSDSSGPYSFQFGSGDCIPGLEPHVQSMKKGERRSFVIPARDGYGVYNKDLVRTIPKDSLPDSWEIKEGLSMTINNMPVTIVNVEEQTVTVDANHPLAGVDLYFNIRIESIDDHPPETLATGCGCGGSCGCDDSDDDRAPKSDTKHASKTEAHHVSSETETTGCGCGGSCGCGGH